jgi:hypothetical protein
LAVSAVVPLAVSAGAAAFSGAAGAAVAAGASGAFSVSVADALTVNIPASSMHTNSSAVHLFKNRIVLTSTSLCDS